MLYLASIHFICPSVNMSDISGNAAMSCFTCFCVCVCPGIMDFYTGVKTQISNANHLFSICYTIIINQNFQNAIPCQVFFRKIFSALFLRLCFGFFHAMLSMEISFGFSEKVSLSVRCSKIHPYLKSMDNFARGMLHIPFEPLAFVAPALYLFFPVRYLW